MVDAGHQRSATKQYFANEPDRKWEALGQLAFAEIKRRDAVDLGEPDHCCVVAVDLDP